MRWPPSCHGDPSCKSDILTTEYHSFTGSFRLAGSAYDGPLTLQLCLSGDDAGSKTAPKSEIHTVALYIPEVTIPRWRLFSP